MQTNMLSKLKCIRWILYIFQSFRSSIHSRKKMKDVSNWLFCSNCFLAKKIIFNFRTHCRLLDWLLRKCQETVYCFHMGWPHPRVAPGNQEDTQPNYCACLQLLTIQVYLWYISEKNKIGTSVTRCVLEERWQPYLILRPPLSAERLFYTFLNTAKTQWSQLRFSMLGPCYSLVLEDLIQNSSMISENKARKKGLFCPY